MAISALAYAGTSPGPPSCGWPPPPKRPTSCWASSAAPTAAGDGHGSQGMAGPKHLACSADYAWLVEAFTRLSEATGEARWISEARAAADALIELFWDHEGGGFFTTGNDGEQLIARMKDIHDGAVPSANATAALALARLGELTGAPGYEEVARRTVRALGPALAVSPASFAGDRGGGRLPVRAEAPGGRVLERPGPRATGLGPLPPEYRAGVGRALRVAAVGGTRRRRRRRARSSCARATRACCRSAKPTRWLRSWSHRYHPPIAPAEEAA